MPIKRLPTLLKSGSRATEAEIKSFTTALTRFLDRELAKLARKLPTMNPREAAIALGTLERSLRDAGLDDYVDQLSSVYKAELSAIEDQLSFISGKKLNLTKLDGKQIEALIELDVDSSTSTIRSYVGDVRSALMRNVLAGEPINTLALSEGNDKLARRMATEANTLLAGFNRTVSMMKGKDAGFTKYLYIGPDDDVIRPFCADRVGRVFTLEEIEEWADDPNAPEGLDPKIFGGGYNCRHKLIPVTETLIEDNELPEGLESDNSEDAQS